MMGDNFNWESILWTVIFCAIIYVGIVGGGGLWYSSPLSTLFPVVGIVVQNVLYQKLVLLEINIRFFLLIGQISVYADYGDI